MTSEQDVEAKFWAALKSDRTMMLGLAGAEDGHSRPMTGQFENDRSPIWFFCSSDNSLIPMLASDSRAVATFASKDHDLFASVGGRLSLETDGATIDRLWSPFVAAWFEGGRDDPKLRLLRLDADVGEVWLNANSLLAGVKLLVGMDPRKAYADKVATIDFR